MEAQNPVVVSLISDEYADGRAVCAEPFHAM